MSFTILNKQPPLEYLEQLEKQISSINYVTLADVLKTITPEVTFEAESDETKTIICVITFEKERSQVGVCYNKHHFKNTFTGTTPENILAMTKHLAKNSAFQNTYRFNPGFAISNTCSYHCAQMIIKN